MKLFTYGNDYILVGFKNVEISKLSTHCSMWISYYLHRVNSKLSRYDWGSLKKQLESGYDPKSYTYIVLDERDNYIIDGNHRAFLLKLNPPKNKRILVKLVKLVKN